MKNIIRNPKKGVAIEISIIAFVIIFAVSSLLVSISVMSNSVGTSALSSQKEKTALTEVALYHLPKDMTYTSTTIEVNGVSYKIEFNTDNFYLIEKTNGGTLTLTIKLYDNKIIFWTYNTK